MNTSNTATAMSPDAATNSCGAGTACKENGKHRFDPLTIAYLAIGAKEELVRRKSANEPAEFSEGELDFISDVVDHAAMLDALGYEAGDRLNGVFAYEVAEEFGQTYAAALFDGKAVNPQELGRKLVEAICIPVTPADSNGE